MPGSAGQVSSLTIVALAAIWLITIMNCISLTVGGSAAVVLTLIKLLMLLAVGAAAFILGEGDWSHLGMSATGGGCDGVAAGARFKLGQDERDAVFRNITTGLRETGAHDLLRWMQALNPER